MDKSYILAQLRAVVAEARQAHYGDADTARDNYDTAITLVEQLVRQLDRDPSTVKEATLTNEEAEALFEAAEASRKSSWGRNIHLEHLNRAVTKLRHADTLHILPEEP